MYVSVFIQKQVVWFNVPMIVDLPFYSSLPVNDSWLQRMKKAKCKSYFSQVEGDHVFPYVIFLDKCLVRLRLVLSYAIHVKAQIASQHQINDHKKVFVVLKAVVEIDDEWVPNLLKQDCFLNGVCHGLMCNALGFADILKGIELAHLASR